MVGFLWLSAGELVPAGMLRDLRRAYVSLLVAAASAMGACLAVLALARMGLYWLDWMALSSALYAAACAVVAQLVDRALSHAARVEVHHL